MKKNFTKTVRTSSAGLILMMLLFTVTLNAQNNLKDLTQNAYAKENLLKALNSDNDGVRKSAIYMVGSYKLADFANILVDRLENENNESIRLLIAYALFETMDAEGLDAVKVLANKDKSQKVRNISSLIYQEYINKLEGTASL
ncbi:MAG TPA: HEAT repeat domain-containing protein [Ignavibacteriaceae bacterium]|nr:HEAT repeat domain-containing protein [Ignavibacteriaceae bacterium]